MLIATFISPGQWIILTWKNNLVGIFQSLSKKLNQNAKSYGCDVEIQIWDDMVHIFQGFAPYLPEANEALESISKFISDK